MKFKSTFLSKAPGSAFHVFLMICITMLLKQSIVMAGLGSVRMVADLNKSQTGPYIEDSSSKPQDFIEFQGNLFFTADDGRNGRALWMFDGTNPPKLVTDLIPGSDPLEPQNLTILNDKLYFTASISKEKILWEFDGQQEFKQIGKEVFDGIDDLVAFNSSLYIADNGYLFRYSDGSGLEEVLQGAVITSTIQSNLVVFESKLYFAASESYGSNTLLNLYALDTDDTIQLIADNQSKGFKGVAHLVVHNEGQVDETLIIETEDETRGYELWYYTGGPPKELVKIAAASQEFLGQEVIATSYNDCFYYGANVDGRRYLFEYDFLNPPRKLGRRDYIELTMPLALTVLHGKLYFVAYENENSDYFIYEYNGSEFVDTTIQHQSNKCTTPTNLFKYDDSLYYSGVDEEKRRELCRFSGNVEPELVADINFANDGYKYDDFTVVGDRLYFRISTDSRDDDNNQLWFYNGKSSPQRVKNDFLAADGAIEELTLFQGKLYFTRINNNKLELWSYANNGKLVESEIIRQNNLSEIRDLYVHRGKLYFYSSRGGSQSGVYEYDGNASLKVILSFDTNRAVAVEFGSAGNNLYFAMVINHSGSQLWKYSGVGSAQLVEEVQGTVAAKYGFASSGSTLFFLGQGDNSFRESLYSYDGETLAKLTGDLEMYYDVGSYYKITMINENVILPLEIRYNDGLYRYTREQKLEPIATQKMDGLKRFSRITQIGSKLYFYAENNIVGFEPFVYGDDIGVRNLDDILTLKPDFIEYVNRISDFTEFKGKVYFTANDGFRGHELYEYTPASGGSIVGSLKLLLLKE